MRLTAHMKKVVEEQALGFVATVCPDGSPNLSPKGTTGVWDDEHLVFLHLRSLREGAEFESIRHFYEARNAAGEGEGGSAREGATATPARRGPPRRASPPG